MALTFAEIMRSAGIDPTETLVLRHAYVSHQDSDQAGIHADSSDAEILTYTKRQSPNPRSFPSEPPPLWVVFLPEGGERARLWAVIRNHGEMYNDEVSRHFDLEVVDLLDDLRNRLVIGWRSPRTWKVAATTAAAYPVREIADARPIPFPGFDSLRLDYAQLQAAVRERRYATWQTALASVVGIYLITDTRDGRVYVGKADGDEHILQRWRTYAGNGHGNNVELQDLDPTSFRFSLLRVFDPATPRHVVDEAESHFKRALDSRRHGLNRN